MRKPPVLLALSLSLFSTSLLKPPAPEWAVLTSWKPS